MQGIVWEPIRKRAHTQLVREHSATVVSARSVITTFNTAVTERASKILGKHRRKKIPWVTAEILDLCDRRRELRKKRFEHEGSEKYKEVNNNQEVYEKCKRQLDRTTV